jgi:CRISPR/Cas system-associated exonuclease Cas4 (RecB family)
MLTRPKSWSYTMLSNFENCPRKAWHMYVAKDLPKVETEAMKWGIRVHEAMEHRLGKKTPLPPEMEKFERLAAVFDERRPRAEFWIQMDEQGLATSFPSKAWGKGKLDALILNNQEDEALIVDWKTGKVREDPFELQVFGLLVRSMWPEVKKIQGMYVWLSDGKAGKTHDLTDTGQTFAKVKGMWNAIQALNPEERWLPNPNPLCGFCAVKTCEFNRTR